MWKCEQCGEQIEDQFDTCWKCAGSPDEPEGGRLLQGDVGGRPGDSMQCPRCSAGMKFTGARQIEEDTRGSLMGALFGDTFADSESFDVYVCTRCGRVELFVAGIGNEFRSQ
jgi:hypothetical protein